MAGDGDRDPVFMFGKPNFPKIRAKVWININYHFKCTVETHKSHYSRVFCWAQWNFSQKRGENFLMKIFGEIRKNSSFVDFEIMVSRDCVWLTWAESSNSQWSFFGWVIFDESYRMTHTTYDQTHESNRMDHKLWIIRALMSYRNYHRGFERRELLLSKQSFCWAYIALMGFHFDADKMALWANQI